MKKKYKILIIILVILVGARIWLPSFLKNKIVAAVNATPGYECTIADVDLALYRGAVCIDSFSIFITENNVRQPFVSLPVAEGSIDWQAILNGRVVAKMYLEDATLNFADGESESEKQSGGTDWTEPLMDIVPLELNTFELVNGIVNFKNSGSEPPVDLSVTDIDMIVTNITNAKNNEGRLPSDITMSALVFETGKLSLSGKMNAVKEVPDADISLNLEGVQLTQLKSFTKAYGKFDFEKGTFTAASEIAVKDGQIKGYLKPFFDDVKVLKWKDEEGGFLSKIWNGVVGGVFELTENQKRDQTATRISIDGDMNSPDVHPLKIVLNVFQNAFIEAFEKSVDNSIDYSDVGSTTNAEDEGQTVIQELFDRDGKLFNTNKGKKTEADSK